MYLSYIFKSRNMTKKCITFLFEHELKMTTFDLLKIWSSWKLHYVSGAISVNLLYDKLIQYYFLNFQLSGLVYLFNVISQKKSQICSFYVWQNCLFSNFFQHKFKYKWTFQIFGARTSHRKLYTVVALHGICRSFHYFYRFSILTNM